MQCILSEWNQTELLENWNWKTGNKDSKIFKLEKIGCQHGTRKRRRVQYAAVIIIIIIYIYIWLTGHAYEKDLGPKVFGRP